MRKALVIALVLLGLSAGPAAALEIKGIRSIYGPFGGVRPGSKMLPGDVLFLAFQIEGLNMEADTGYVKYNLKLEVSDSSGKVIFKRENEPVQQHLHLGGARISERAQVGVGLDQPPGKYTLRLTVTDLGGKGKNGPSKSFTYDFEVLKPAFGLIAPALPSIAVPLQRELTATCILVGMARNAKMLPDVELRMRVLDEAGKPTLPKPFISDLLKILPDAKDLPADFDITKQKAFPLPFPLVINRPGRFTVEIEAYDRIAKKTAKLTLPLRVLESSEVGGK
jgi:hypothetical protein